MPDQTITYDDFEKSLELAGIEIIIPAEDDDEPPEGIGASGFTPRKTAPSATNPYYLKKGYGGYNRCILINSKTGSCLPNCVGYAFGRYLEIGGKTANSKLPTCNAEDWLATAKANGLSTGNAPRPGDVIVWKSGALGNGKDGCGHVAVVEEIDNEGAILVSQSNYGGTRFFLTKHLPPYDILGQTFIGFIHNQYYEGMWKKNSKGWWYEYPDGSYPKSCWKDIDGKTYHFDAKGYMQTGWIKEDGKWYFLSTHKNSTEGMLIKSKMIFRKGKFNFLGKNGEMFIGDHTVPVHFNKDGALEAEVFE